MYKYQENQLVNEDGTGYGYEYILDVSDNDFSKAQQWLIDEVIGLKYYHSNRDVWNQIIIKN